MAKILDNDIVVIDFQLPSGYYIYFRTNTLWKSLNILSPKEWV